MRLVYLTTGTGSFYCGSCMRDNALVRALRARGHDALLVPMYLPLTLDEASAADNVPVFFGGINSYLQQVSPLFRKTPRWVDKLFDAPGMLAAAGKRSGMTRASELGPMTLSMLQGEEGNQVKELERLVAFLADEKPDWVVLSNALLIGMGRRIREATGAKIACTLQGEDGFLDALGAPYSEQCWKLIGERGSEFDALIPVSHYHGGLMQRRAGLPSERLHVVYNGIDLTGYTPRSVPPQELTLGYLARMYEPKGLGTLVDAFLLLAPRVPALRLAVAGAQVGYDPTYVAQLTAKLTAAGLGDRVRWLPNISREEKIQFLQSLTVLSVPATYGESFGLYVIEALAAGVPVVQPRHAVFPELLAQTRGGLLYDPLTPAALADALESLVTDPQAAFALGAEGQKAVFARFGVDTMAQGVEAALRHGAAG
ncbi:glycosyltransferase family 4 protein [Armatimonas rosea]|uniref:Glycosyltransferase involved in cell wall biosynthesis n=1 Tax=Armatimonas rosea TaxID=685828 RepID=A0A7W9W8F2_ARMRO|nr:glycosyltransferase family 4 protein [Armatimonas rosea]MBB6052201.1 glycosyltransferase involved in cell wall biosynthesis [Armatimonas rosea]